MASPYGKITRRGALLVAFGLVAPAAFASVHTAPASASSYNMGSTTMKLPTYKPVASCKTRRILLAAGRYRWQPQVTMDGGTTRFNGGKAISLQRGTYTWTDCLSAGGSTEVGSDRIPLAEAHKSFLTGPSRPSAISKGYVFATGTHRFDFGSTLTRVTPSGQQP